jgi:hypothetical protein
MTTEANITSNHITIPMLSIPAPSEISNNNLQANTLSSNLPKIISVGLPIISGVSSLLAVFAGSIYINDYVEDYNLIDKQLPSVIDPSPLLKPAIIGSVIYGGSIVAAIGISRVKAITDAGANFFFR